MELPERVARIEAVIPTLATKTDLADLRTEMHKEFSAQTWRIITLFAVISSALVAGVYWIATHT